MAIYGNLANHQKQLESKVDEEENPVFQEEVHHTTEIDRFAVTRKGHALPVDETSIHTTVAHPETESDKKS